MMMIFRHWGRKMMSEYKKMVERRYYTITGEVPEEAVIEKIISHSQCKELLKTAILKHDRAMVLDTVQEIQERYDAAQEVEKSLLEAQGSAWMTSSAHMTSASHYVKDGNRELKSARQYQCSSFRCLCIGIIFLLVIIILIIVPMATSLKKA
ncbi:Syntaxin-related protein KNOLLE [Rhynchospora pubera]|uniref:Syntaxin-related protein KNOLLE n=1 Tax=Rhynchospora pubera TaxID=906938 RepID=A0AAV8E4H3_9POAL|nr:Syntaxin-related protein KNOLLE [Rhynchospora pubera]